MDFDYKALGFWFSVATFLYTNVVAIYVYLSNRGRISDKQISTLENRVTAVETELAHAPSHDDLASVYESINKTNEKLGDVTAQLGRLEGELKPLRTQLGNVLNHLINGGK